MFLSSCALFSVSARQAHLQHNKLLQGLISIDFVAAGTRMGLLLLDLVLLSKADQALVTARNNKSLVQHAGLNATHKRAIQTGGHFRLLPNYLLGLCLLVCPINAIWQDHGILGDFWTGSSGVPQLCLALLPCLTPILHMSLPVQKPHIAMIAQVQQK